MLFCLPFAATICKKLLKVSSHFLTLKGFLSFKARLSVMETAKQRAEMQVPLRFAFFRQMSMKDKIIRAAKKKYQPKFLERIQTMVGLGQNATLSK